MDYMTDGKNLASQILLKNQGQKIHEDQALLRTTMNQEGKLIHLSPIKYCHREKNVSEIGLKKTREKESGKNHVKPLH